MNPCTRCGHVGHMDAECALAVVQNQTEQILRLRRSLENWRGMGLGLWRQFAQYTDPEGYVRYSDGGLSVLEDLQTVLTELKLIDEHGVPVEDKI